MKKIEQDDTFRNYSYLQLNSEGQFVDGKTVITTRHLKRHLSSKINVKPGTTDVFVWVHGWRNKKANAIEAAKTLFPAILNVQQRNADLYGRIKRFQPHFVAVHWPSWSLPTKTGYKKMRDRAAYMTEEGEAEFFLAQLLGYLESENAEAPKEKRKLLASKQGFFVHCIGHSFGGRFLTASVCAAHQPTPKTKKLSGPRDSFEYTIDSLLVFQMAAPAWGFANQLEMLATNAPIAHGNGRIVLTHSEHDLANGFMHSFAEGEQGIGFKGALAPKKLIGRCNFKFLADKYSSTDFKKRIVNVNADQAFKKNSVGQGSHSDFWYEDSVHLILTLADRARM